MQPGTFFKPCSRLAAFGFIKAADIFFGVAELCFFALEFDGTFTSPQKNQTFQANKSEFDWTGLVYVNLHIIHLFIPLSKFNKNKIRIIACFLNICFSSQLGCSSNFNIFDKLLGLRLGRELWPFLQDQGIEEGRKNERERKWRTAQTW